MQDPKNNIIHRLQIAAGHLQKVLDMVKEDEYCIDIVHQSMAVQAALKKVDEIVLEDHLKTCVSDSIRAGHAEESIKEIMEILAKK